MTAGSYFIDGIGSEELEFLRDPRLSLPALAKVVDQENEGEIDYDPFAITYHLQETIIAHAADPPRTETGHVTWLTILGYRQGGKSTTAELAYYPHAAYNHGWKHVCIADNDRRSDELHSRLQFNHSRWDENLRPPVKPANKNETRQITFEHDSTMQVLSGASQAAAVGLSVSSLHASEVAYWKNAARQFSILYPAMVNRKNAHLLNECTPTPMNEPSAEWWKDQCNTAKHGIGRHIYAFFPFWDGKLNTRPWPDGASIDIEEQRLLDRYGPLGLTLENLAFRRFMMETDSEIRRNTELFSCYYPFDDVSCWLVGGRQVIPSRSIERHTKLGGNDQLQPWRPKDAHGVRYYKNANAGASYVIGVDPAGYAGRDHAAFQVLEVWSDGEKDDWEQVATFGAVCDPHLFCDYLMEAGHRYNNAVIAVEANAGAACIGLLKERGYPNIYHDWKRNQPGVWKSSDEEFVRILTDALLDRLLLRDEDLVNQLSGYRGDAAVQRTIRAELLSGQSNGRRRDRHHWDKVSALMVACIVAPKQPSRFKPKAAPSNIIMHPAAGMTWNEMVEYDKKVARMTGGAKRGRMSYTRRRR